MDNQQQTKTISPVKRGLAFGCIIVMIICGINAFRNIYKLQNPKGYYNIDAKNASIEMFTSDSKVYYTPVCPDCGHIHDSYQRNMSAGEKYETTFMCEYCYEVFWVTIHKGK